jgi:hypothetical protein
MPIYTFLNWASNPNMFYMKRHQRSWILQDAEIDSVAMPWHKLSQTKYNYIIYYIILYIYIITSIHQLLQFIVCRVLGFKKKPAVAPYLGDNCEPRRQRCGKHRPMTVRGLVKQRMCFVDGGYNPILGFFSGVHTV